MTVTLKRVKCQKADKKASATQKRVKQYKTSTGRNVKSLNTRIFPLFYTLISTLNKQLYSKLIELKKNKRVEIFESSLDAIKVIEMRCASEQVYGSFSLVLLIMVNCRIDRLDLQLIRRIVWSQFTFAFFPLSSTFCFDHIFDCRHFFLKFCTVEKILSTTLQFSPLKTINVAF